MKALRALLALALAMLAAPVLAGPPYLTDDPVPTDTGHWEIYAFTAAEGRHATLDADLGLDLNYGPVQGVQLTATLPLAVSHQTLVGWRSGVGDLEFGVKYRFLDDQPDGFSAAIFPRAILPTSSLSTNGKTRFLLPLWVEEDLGGGTSLFGGSGYLINPGAGNRDFWQLAVALSHDLSKQASIGAEVTRQGSDSVGGTAQTRVSVGSVAKLSDHYALLVSAGPTWTDHRTGYHLYAALGLNF